MLNRRKFLALSAAAWPAMAFGAGKHIPLGVQLYTIRDLVKSDNLLPLLKQIRAIGYEEVELFPGVYSHSARELSTDPAPCRTHRAQRTLRLRRLRLEDSICATSWD